MFFPYPLFAALVFAILCGLPVYASDFSMSRLQAGIKNRFHASGNAPVAGQELISGMTMMPLIYRSRAYMPFWIDAGHRLPAADALIEAIDRAGDDGLVPADYHRVAISRLLSHGDHPQFTDNDPVSGAIG